MVRDEGKSVTKPVYGEGDKPLGAGARSRVPDTVERATLFDEAATTVEAAAGTLPFAIPGAYALATLIVWVLVANPEFRRGMSGNIPWAQPPAPSLLAFPGAYALATLVVGLNPGSSG